jgi:hypothetical protein
VSPELERLLVLARSRFLAKTQKLSYSSFIEERRFKEVTCSAKARPLVASTVLRDGKCAKAPGDLSPEKPRYIARLFSF